MKILQKNIKKQFVSFKILHILLILILKTSSLWAETIVLKNGQTLEAKVIKQTEKYLKIDFLMISIFFFLNRHGRLKKKK